MIPYLYKSDETSFNSGFIGIFDNALSCNVVETLNGAFELHMQILNNDPNLENMAVGSIIVAKPNQTYGNQPFIIEQIIKRIDGTIEVYAVHMSQHRTKLIPVSPFTATDLADTIDKIAANSQEANPFTITTDKSVATSFKLDVPKTMRELMGGSEGSIIDIYGGEWFYNNFDLMLMNRRGRTDSNLKVLYGSNMTEYVETDEFSWSMSYTGILPYYKDEENLVVGDIQYSDHVDDYSYHKTIAYDFTDRFDSVPTKVQLETVCQNFLNGKGNPHVSIDVSFEDLSTMPIYGMIYENVEHIQLGDTVEIINSAYNVQFRSRVRTLDYDVLLERYNTIKIGDQTETINDVISDIGGSEGASSGGGSGTVIYDGETTSDPLYPELFMKTISTSGTDIVKQIIDADGNNIFPNVQGGVKMDLLWTNPNPTSNYGTTAEYLDLSDYDIFIPVFRGATASTWEQYYSVVANIKQIRYRAQARVAKIMRTRDFIIFDDRIEYGTGKNWPDNSESSTDDASVLVPQTLYGIKFSWIVPTTVQGLQYIEV